MVFRQADLTPCGVLFDVFKRKGGISHKELAGLILSDRPLSDGRSASSRAADRTWLSHFIVHAPVGSLQPGYFRDWGLAAQRIMSRLRQHGPRSMTFEKIIDLVCSEGCEPMCTALAACYQNVQLYRNALARFSKGQGHTTGEHAEALLVLFVAVGCSAQVRMAIDYALEYVDKNLGGRMGTPESVPMNAAEAGATAAVGDAPHAIGLVRVSEGYLTGDIHWIDPVGEGAVIGAVATGAADISDVEEDVSAEHARVSWDAERSCWLLRDLGSTNGTRLVSGANGEEKALDPGETAELYPGDEITLGASTTFVIME